MRNEPERRGVSEEIELFALIEVLWKRKLMIILTAAIVTAGAAAYAMFTIPIYEAKVVIHSPTQNDISQLNYGRGGKSGLPMFSVKDVYDIYLRNLQSESVRQEFFRKVFLPSLPDAERNGSKDELYARFNNVLRVAGANKNAPNRYVVQVELSDPEQAAKWVVQYAQLAGDHAKREVTKDARADAMVKANNLEQQITASRESARKIRQDEIAQLAESLKVAKSIGLEKPPIISNSLSAEVSAGMDGSLTYMRGSKALEAEIDNLQRRVSDDPFVNNLRQRQEALTFYRSLQIDPSVIEVYRQDGALESPDKPVRPRKVLIVVLGLLVGIALGVLLVVFHQVLFGARVERDQVVHD